MLEPGRRGDALVRDADRMAAAVSEVVRDETGPLVAAMHSARSLVAVGASAH